MKSFLRLIVLLFKMGPTRLLRAVESSNKDPLTGIKNVRGFFIFAEKEIERSKRTKRPFSVVFFDVDNLKKINDELGHLAGDEHLKLIASFIEKNTRDIDVFCRWGGDEFVLLLPETNRKEAEEVGKKIKEVLPVSFGVVYLFTR